MAAAPAGNPKSMAIILLFSAAFLSSITTAASSSEPPAPPSGKPSSVEICVKLLFDPPAKAPPMMKRILCRDLLREIVTSFKITGKLSPEYPAALKKLQKFKNNPDALKKYLCGLSSEKKFGCNKTGKLPTLRK